MMREKISEAFMRRAFPGGMPDQTALDDPALFGEVVRHEVKGRAGPRPAAYLRRPDVARRWLVALGGLRRDVEAQLDAGGAKGAECRCGRGEDHERWRRSAVRFLGHVESRMEEARALLEESGMLPPAAETAGVDEGPSTNVTDLLHFVRHYLVVESDLPEEARAAKRERLISAVDGAISSCSSRERVGKANAAGGRGPS